MILNTEDEDVEVTFRGYKGDELFLYNKTSANSALLKAYADKDADITFLTPWGKISRWDLFLQGDSGGGNQSNSGQSGGDANDIVSAGVGVAVNRTGGLELLQFRPWLHHPCCWCLHR